MVALALVLLSRAHASFEQKGRTEETSEDRVELVEEEEESEDKDVGSSSKSDDDNEHDKRRKRKTQSSRPSWRK